MSRSLVEHLTPQSWESQKPGSSGFERVRWLQGIVDLVNRPAINRAQASTNATAVNANGAIQSSGIGTGQLQPKRYAEFTVKARVTFNVNSVGPAYIFVHRTLGAIPANGAAPNVGDVIVGGDAFLGGPTANGVNQSGAFSFIDTGLDATKQYRYYLSVQGPNANVLNLVNASQVFVMERS
ncbi:MAG: hypothetical protein JWO19_4426 [Bryobacterales bacterium]|nr:hypothetical protein [Bryobacterales bacterium]